MTIFTSAGISSVIQVLSGGLIPGFAAADLGIGRLPSPGGVTVGGVAVARAGPARRGDRRHLGLHPVPGLGPDPVRLGQRHRLRADQRDAVDLARWPTPTPTIPGSGAVRPAGDRRDQRGHRRPGARPGPPGPRRGGHRPAGRAQQRRRPAGGPVVGGGGGRRPPRRLRPADGDGPAATRRRGSDGRGSKPRRQAPRAARRPTLATMSSRSCSAAHPRSAAARSRRR